MIAKWYDLLKKDFNVTHHIFLHKFLMVFIQVDAQGLEDACLSCMYRVILRGKENQF